MIDFKKLFSLIPLGLRRRLVFLQVIFFVTAVFQVAGIASIAPFIAIISNPDVIANNAILSYVYQILEFNSDRQFLVFSAMAIALLILVSNSIASFSMWYLFKFSVSVWSEIQSKIYGQYVNSSYEFFSQRNSSSLISNITNELPRFIYMVFQPALNLVAQSLIACLILIGLVVVDPILAGFSIIVVIGIYLLIYWTIRLRMEKCGDVVTSVNRDKLKLLNESLRGIKEVKLLNVEPWYENRIKSTTLRGLNANAFISVAGEFPRFIVETFVFIAILVLAIYLFTTQGTTGNAITTLSFYAMAGYKLLPAAQTIYKSISSIKANFSVVNSIYHEMQTDSGANRSGQAQNENKTRSIPLDGNIDFIDVSYCYPGAENAALSQINCVIERNSFNAFVGGSGAGKSTMADLLLGLLVPTSGKIESGSVTLCNDNIRDWQTRIGYVPQSIFLIDDTVRRNIAFGIPSHKVVEGNVIKAAKLAQLESVFGDLSNGLEMVVGENGSKLSGGQIQRIGIARALYKNPDILIFDEATSALDAITEHQIIDAIKKIAMQKTVVMIAHRLSTIIDAENIIMFDEGRVVDQGRYDDLYESSEKFRKLVDAGGRSSTFYLGDL